MTIYAIELQPLPNQQFSLTINNINMNVDLKAAGSNTTNENELTQLTPATAQIMLFAMQINGEYVCPYVPVFANQGLLPYKYMVSIAGGNFFFETDQDEYPNWQNFGTSCYLYFITEDELES